MSVLTGAGHIERFPGFDRSVPLVARLDALPCITEHARILWEEARELQSDPAVTAALARLLARKPLAAAGRERPARRGLRRRIARFIGRH
jgi:hypothetical protein